MTLISTIFLQLFLLHITNETLPYQKYNKKQGTLARASSSTLIFLSCIKYYPNVVTLG